MNHLGGTIGRLVSPAAVLASRATLARVTASAAALILLLALAASSELSAQGADRNRMTAGDSVRVRLTGRMTVAAEFNRWEDDGILLDVDGFADPYSVDLTNMERLDVYMVRTPRESFRHGAILGASAGLFIGAAVGLVLHQTGVIDDEDAPPAELVTDGLTFAGLGLVGGALVGGFYAGTHPRRGWIRVQLPVS
ncbi:MAG: hypothetical protein R3253_09385 [Longimicrobiales bacterium]|nr:hypothetical protein [Longimicrobiales bacterium]